MKDREEKEGSRCKTNFRVKNFLRLNLRRFREMLRTHYLDKEKKEIELPDSLLLQKLVVIERIESSEF